jgi:Tol biopolymer transport system component
VVVIGLSESKPYKSLLSGTPPAIVFSPDSKRFAYSAELGDQQWTVVGDGAEGQVYDSVTIPMFSPDSRHVLHKARRGKNEFVVVDGVEGPPFAGIAYGLSPFSPDGKRVAYLARLSHNNYVLVGDGRPSKPYEHIEYITSSYFSPDSQHIVFAARKGEKVHVVLDGKESPACDGIAEMPVFSPDGKHMAYAAARGWSATMILDGVAGKKYGNIYHPVFSPDSKHLAYAAVRGLSAFVVRDGKEVPSHWLADLSRGGIEIVFSPDSKRLAYHLSVAGRASRVVVDGTNSMLYERIEHGSLKFSSDSRHVAYWAAPFSGEWRVYVDGYSTEKYDGPLFRSQLVFDGPDTLRALTQRGDQIFRLDIKIPSSSQ